MIKLLNGFVKYILQDVSKNYGGFRGEMKSDVMGR